MYEKLLPSVPNPVHAEVKVEIQLPPEVQTILRDLHSDRQAIGAGSLIMLFCAVLTTWKALFGRAEK